MDAEHPHPGSVPPRRYIGGVIPNAADLPKPAAPVALPVRDAVRFLNALDEGALFLHERIDGPGFGRVRWRLSHGWWLEVQFRQGPEGRMEWGHVLRIEDPTRRVLSKTDLVRFEEDIERPRVPGPAYDGYFARFYEPSARACSTLGIVPARTLARPRLAEPGEGVLLAPNQACIQTITDQSARWAREVPSEPGFYWCRWTTPPGPDVRAGDVGPHLELAEFRLLPCPDGHIAGEWVFPGDRMMRWSLAEVRAFSVTHEFWTAGILPPPMQP